MNIKELYLELEDNDFVGEITLHKNNIIWEYVADVIISGNDFEDDENFEINSVDDELLDVYNSDKDKMELILDQLNVLGIFEFSEYVINDNKISFKIS